MPLDQELLALPSCHHDRNLPYLPRPNLVEVVLTERLAPLELAPTAFVLPFLPDGRCVFARNRRRGLEIPGGHKEPGESLEEAAAREAWEEVGCRIDNIRPLGFLRMTSSGPRPHGYKYPYPVGFQQFFVATVRSMANYVPNDECLTPLVLRPTEVNGMLESSRLSHKLFHEAGLRTFLLEMAPDERSVPGLYL